MKQLPSDSILETLINARHIHKSTTHVCDACVRFADIYLGGPATKTVLKGPIFEKVNDCIKKGSYRSGDLEMLATALGSLVVPSLRAACVDTNEKPKLDSMFVETYEENWVAQNPVLRAFLEAIAPTSYQKLWITLEELYILSMSVQSHWEKIWCCILLSSGSYSSVVRVCNQLSKDPMKCPAGDVFTTFDNLQKVGRQWRISLGRKLPLSTITAISCFYGEKSHIKTQELLQIPTLFSPSVSTANENLQLYTKFQEEMSRVHTAYGFGFLLCWMKNINIQEEFLSGAVLENFNDGLDYSRVPTETTDEYNVIDFECLPMNPNSEAVLKEVMEHLLQICNESNPNQNWIICVCDGLPFSICIVFVSMTAELIWQFITWCKLSNHAPSSDLYESWIKENSNPNTRLASDFVFSVLHPLFLFRAAVRSGNQMVSLIAREKCSAIFFGGNHPKYREVNAYEIFYALNLRKNYPNVLASVSSVRLKGKKYGQGLDFQLEECIKAAMRWVHSKGVPTVEQWQRATASTTKLENIKASVCQNLGVDLSYDFAGIANLSKEIFTARKYFRKIGIFSSAETNLRSATEPWSVVPKSFANFGNFCESNRMKYYTAYLNETKVRLPLILNESHLSLSKEELIRHKFFNTAITISRQISL
ncbi:unnamed protein product [Orchesella dallaii]|uniref:Uncharacterized protein n=1 Tax=Orchesella dallaii TaxID=48710 RepID=A0ABP1R4S2_9HEXA